MLTHLTISNFAIVETLDLDITRKLTVITGETGAGKSIMIDALGLTLGDRADSGSVRHGAKKAEILATFDIQNNPAALSWLAQRELDADQECILRRVVSQDGRSRAYINGTPSPIQALKSLGEQLISIHGQHEHQALLKKETHRQLLDEFGNLNGLAAQTANQYMLWKEKYDGYLHFRNHAKEMQDRADLLRFQINELDSLNPVENEWSELEKEHKKLSNVDWLASLGEQALTRFNENEPNLISQIQSILPLLQQMSKKDTELKEVINLVDSGRIQLEEAADSLNRYLNGLEMNPERYQSLDARMSSYFQLARKHHVEPQRLYQAWQALLEELNAIDGGDEKLNELEQAAEEAQKVYIGLAKQLSSQRQQQASKLSSLITKKIHPLGMPGAEFTVAIQPLAPDEFSVNGLEHIEFIAKTNPGQPAKPLSKVASGGELSRISLAIQVACAAQSNVATLVFDEVDVGIGGGVAQTVGKLLRQLGQNNQVLCVTHLPQVAAQGHTHLHVNKRTKKNETHTNIARLSQNEVAMEIARMLGGIKVTDQSLAHAKELITESQT